MRPRKLTDEQAAEIRAKAKAGEPHIRIAREFGVSRQTVYIILQGKTHKRGA
jgi:DNA invertase Pin-like site-specific DNA recombinase